MSKGKFWLLFSVLANVVFIFVLVFLVKDTTKNFGDFSSKNKSEKITTIQNFTPSPAVIGEEVENRSFDTSETILVSKVIDGDTIVLESGEVVRYIGIDTPESEKECFAKEAADKNKELVAGKLVRLEKDVSERDRYQRLLRYVWSGDIFVNEYLVRQGYATAISYPPDVKYQKLFRLAEKEAREKGRGLWKECSQEVSEVSKVPELTEEGNWECSKNVYNCSDFSTHADAQSVLETCGVEEDIHKLDRDDDGVACESLP